MHDEGRSEMTAGSDPKAKGPQHAARVWCLSAMAPSEQHFSFQGGARHAPAFAAEAAPARPAPRAAFFTDRPHARVRIPMNISAGANGPAQQNVGF